MKIRRSPFPRGDRHGERVLADLFRLVALAPPPQRRQLVWAVVMTALATTADLGSLALLGPALSATGTERVSGQAAPLVGFMLTAMSASAFRLASLRQTIAAQYGVASAFAVTAFERLQRQEYADYLACGPSHGIAAFERLHMLLFQALLPLISGIAATCSLVLLLVGVLVVEPLAGLMFAILTVAASLLFGPMAGDAADRLSELADLRGRLLHQGRVGFRDVFLTNGQDRLVRDFAAVDRELRDRQAAAIIAAQSTRHFLELAGFGAVLAGFLALSTFGHAGMRLVPLAGLLALAGLRVLPHLAAVRSAWRTIVAHGQVTRDVLALLVPPGTAPGLPNVQPPCESIRLEAVTVRRAGRADPLREVSLSIPRGARIGIAGPSGTGKSTLLDVLAGAVVPSAGSILIDGVPLNTTTARAWRERVGIVSQNPVLLGRNLGEVVVFPHRSEEIDRVRFDWALRLSGVEEMAAAFERGLDTPVGEAVEHLSGGQRQRLAFAHALYRARDLLLLDEASGQLDSASERALIESLKALRADLSIVLVSHRPGFFACCNVVYELRDGQLRPIAVPGTIETVPGAR